MMLVDADSSSTPRTASQSTLKPRGSGGFVLAGAQCFHSLRHQRAAPPASAHAERSHRTGGELVQPVLRAHPAADRPALEHLPTDAPQRERGGQFGFRRAPGRAGRGTQLRALLDRRRLLALPRTQVEEPHRALRPAMPRTNETASGSKLGIDATKKLPGEGFKRAWPPLIQMDAAVKAKVETLTGSLRSSN